MRTTVWYGTRTTDDLPSVDYPSPPEVLQGLTAEVLRTEEDLPSGEYPTHRDLYLAENLLTAEDIPKGEDLLTAEDQHGGEDLLIART